MSLKQLFAALFLALPLGCSVLAPHNADFLSKKTHMIIYADGTPKEILDERQPIMQSWRENIVEIRNMCKLVQCNFQFLKVNQYPNRFASTKCFLVNSSDACESQVEKNSIYTIEQLFHQSDYATTITLGNETFGLVGNSKTEDAMVVLEIDPSNLITEDEADNLGKKLKLK